MICENYGLCFLLKRTVLLDFSLPLFSQIVNLNIKIYERPQFETMRDHFFFHHLYFSKRIYDAQQYSNNKYRECMDVMAKLCCQ